ncbi:uncharacterized protein LOC117567054 [Drosophila albomicans]|uniref:Uncharacterized protein LOC117567054 n=1 Tax=Drosophila albomicans TaxID=7291 RepID=A0A6P8WTH8_DROAB|nr:uncharacterized protein LOC117567054 [Drosophila albomicans]XP_051862129.1 uncharacterized protein LOC117567054 [Drosophila albomicans]XP_051862131.1 uncharacterized protein LOC117567054 [Drosophila albomicans]XP_051862132.1 uncharacterized protein LOC117567054 [Drosophila albomicans]XP_051862133.1 uncharacterized protein LOC117567054 [Drosophila albomicans]XP_051862134.1 uncharacterized protein LOC117567054 [Drosophila albomicans]XP_051862135.1 uncharacterized protein LOC117567054 [Drosop
MRKFLIFVALCVICQAAPSNIKGETLKLHLSREKRNEEHGHGGPPAIKPDSVKARESLQHHAGLPIAEEHGHGGPAPIKPHSVLAREGLQHNSEHGKQIAGALIAHEALSNHKKSKRDIPVPTEIKTTAAPKEDAPKEPVAPIEAVALPEKVPSASPASDVGSTTPHGPLRHRPVPVAELFNKAKPGSSEEESKESKESKETKA